MKRYSLLMASLVINALILAGCGEETVPQATPAPQAVVRPPVAQAPQPSAQAEAQPAMAEKYVYVEDGRRDPFMPLLAVRGKASGRDFANPLEAFDLVQYQLKGVIIGIGEPKAIVAAPDGKSYILKPGLKIGKSNGVIREINHERIVVEEQYQDLSGKTHTNIQEIKVPKREGV